MRKFYIFLILSAFLVLFFPSIAHSQNYIDLYKPYKNIYTGQTFIEHTAIGDVNNDGHNDIVAASTGFFDPENDSKIFVFLQDKLKTPHGFLPPVKYDMPYEYGFHPYIIIEDVNSDNLMDIIISLEDGFGVFCQNSGGKIDQMQHFPTTHPRGTFGNSISVGDYNNDGRNDVVISSSGQNNFCLEIFIQTNTGTFTTPTLYNIPFYGIYISTGRLNSDNRDDIVVGNFEKMAVLLQNSNGTMDIAEDYTSTYSTNWLCVGDVNNNGQDEVVAIYEFYEDYNIGIYYPNSNGLLTNPPVYYGNINDSFYGNVVDVNRDGLNDIALVGLSLRALHQTAGGGLETNIDTYLVSGTHYDQDGGFGDVNDDGLLDIVIGGNDHNVNVSFGCDMSPTVVLRSPNGGQEYNIDSTIRIEYEKVGDIEVLDLSYSINGGTSWQTIATGLNSSSVYYYWTAPLTPSNNCLIKVTDPVSGSEDISFYPFSIVDDGVDRLILSTPGNGDELVASTIFPITWQSSGTVSNVRLQYSINNGASWSTIVSSTANNGSYDWTVPNNPSTSCKVRITDTANSDTTDTSDGTFTIYAPGTEVITVTSPNGGESLTGGSTHTITWTHTGNIPMVTLAYSIDNGANWSNIANVSNTGSYTWTVPKINSHNCLIEVRDYADNDPSDRSNSTFSINTIVGPSITVLSPNGGEYLYYGQTHDIQWQSTTAVVGNVHIQYSTNNGVSWTTIVNSTANDGHYAWTIPNVKSSQCLVRIREASDNDPSDTSDAVFTIDEAGATLSITSPQNGDHWQVNSKQTIKWIKGSNTTNKVKLQYSMDNQSTWKTITSSTSNDGSYSWTIPNTPSTTCNVKITDVSKPEISNISYGSFSIVSGSGSPVITLNRDVLYFNAVKLSSSKTPPQTITIDNSGYDTLHWTATVFESDGDDDEESLWLKIQNYSGVQSGQVTVSVNPSGLAVGTYDGAIKISDDDASNSPQMVSVIFNVKAAGSDADPFGAFETPINNSTVMSSIPVTGWAIDDIGIEKVTIWRNALSGEGSGQIYIGDAVLVEGARPDVEQAYPTYPMGYQAGWGYMLLTNMLPNNGNGTFTLHAYAKDVGGKQVKLGSKTITCDNANAVKPFGAIDSPAQGGDASLSSFRNQGWVLTPMPNKIPENGSTIKMYIDGQMMGDCNYNIYRQDIATLFPGYANSRGSMAYIDFDTTAFENGIHTIQWVATDNAGNTDGIGSRYFTIQNSGYNRVGVQNLEPLHRNKKWAQLPDLNRIPFDVSNLVQFKTGYNENSQNRSIKPNKKGLIHLDLPQNKRLILNLKQPQTFPHSAYLLVNQQLRPLPPGSSFDANKGIFYWQPGPACFGKYKLIFLSNDLSGKSMKKSIIINITAN